MFSVYRTGGDEFMVLGPDCDAEDTEQYIASVQDALQAIGYMASFGYAMYASGDKLDDVCNTADARMYEDKHRYRFRTDSREAVTG